MANGQIVWTKRPSAEIGRNLARAAQAAPGAFNELAQFHAARGETRAKSTTLYRDQSGNLRAGTFGEADGTTIYLGAMADYTVPVHEGTMYMASRPFLKDAADQTAPEYFQDAGELSVKILSGGGR